MGLAFAGIFGRRAGLIGAALLALCRMHIFYTPFTLIATIQAFWVVALLYAAVLAARKRALWRWALAGLVCGLANTTRGNMILIIPFLLLLAGWVLRRQRKQQILAIALVAVLFYLPQIPFSLINQRAGKGFRVSTAAGKVLALGNTPESPPAGREPGGSGPMAYPETYGVWMQQADSGERSVVGNIWGWFTDEPMACLELKFRMFLLFWNRAEIPNNVSIVEPSRQPGESTPVGGPILHAPVLAGFWLIGSLGLAGVLLSLRRCRRRPIRLFAVVSVIVYCASIVLFYILARFRLPVMPLLCGFAGYAAVVLWRLRRLAAEKDKRRQVFVQVVVVILCFGVVCIGYDVYRFGWEHRVMSWVRPNGVQLQFPEKVVVKDNGPGPGWFGGWVPVPVGEGLSIRKELIVPMAPADASKVVMRLAVFVPEPAIIQVQMAGGFRQAKGVHPQEGQIQWLSWELAPENYVYTDEGRFLVNLEITQHSGASAQVIIDTQRIYGRTDCVTAPPGELAFSVELYR